MFSLGNLGGLVLLGLIALYWWQSGQFKGRARHLAQHHCQQLGLQLLDDSMVITGFWPGRDALSRPAFRRSYQFEFASTGDQRYHGKITLIGMNLEAIEFGAYKIPPQD